MEANGARGRNQMQLRTPGKTKAVLELDMHNCIVQLSNI
jgi:hypothetical protein